MRYIFLFLLVSWTALAQTGIGTTTPHASAKLEVSASDKGFLPPRVALTAANVASPVTSPANGLMVFNTATAGSGSNQVVPGYYYWNSSSALWLRFDNDNLGNHTASVNIILNGNFISNDGGNEGIRVDNDGNVGIGTNTPTAKLNIAGGGIRIASGLGNTSIRPSVNTSTIGNYEIRGVGGGSPQNDGQDDGFLRISAGGGTNAIQQSSIDLSGYSATVPDMNSNIVMRTAGTERVRIDNSGSVNITGKINLTDPSGNVSTKAAAFVDAGTFVTLDNLKATVTTSGARGLGLATVSGTISLYVQGVYTNQSGAANTSFTDVPFTYSTNVSGSLFGWSFGLGNTIIYHLTDATNSRLYRVTLIIMPSYLKNFISIERLL
jgi:hypothetical protein